MKIIQYRPETEIEEIYKALNSGAVIMHLNNVYAVVAIANTHGIVSLDKIKSRRPNKCYGTLVSNPELFLNESDLDNDSVYSLISIIKKGGLKSCFLRLQMSCLKDSELTVNGTHQGLIVEEPIRGFCARLEAVCFDKKGFIERLICSSANISGDPKGSITNREEAIKFGKERGAKAFIEFDFTNADVESGSFPIFSFQNMSFSIERKGPGYIEIESLLSQSGFSKII